MTPLWAAFVTKSPAPLSLLHTVAEAAEYQFGDILPKSDGGSEEGTNSKGPRVCGEGVRGSVTLQS